MKDLNKGVLLGFLFILIVTVSLGFTSGWKGGVGGPIDAYYYVSTANGTLTNEIIVSANVNSILTAADYAAIKTLIGYYTATTDLDSELQALAALTFADDKIILGTGAGTITTADCSAYAQTILDDADEATFKATVNLEAGTDFYSIAAADAAFEAELDNSAGLLAALDDETGTGLAVFSISPRFGTDIGIGSAILNEAELEILDGATLTTTQINYLNAATGTTGTNTTNLVYSESPGLTGNPELADATYTSLTGAATPLPGWVFRDSDNEGTDKEIAKIYANATTTTDGAEDGSLFLQVKDSGSEKTVFAADADTTAESVQVGATDSTYNMHIYHKIDATVDRWSGEAVHRTVKAGQTSLFGQVLHVDTDGELIVADADVASAGAAPGLFVALEAGTGSKLVLMRGFITETDWDWTPGAILYLDDDPTENEGWTAVAGIPATTGDQVQVLGVAISADTIYFNPSLVLVEVP